jgi:sarcosine oxidase
MNHDVAVVGRGMIGSAAARHLVEGGRSVALVGPAEAMDRGASQGPFSSHPDEGRITRVAGRTDVWSQVAARSIARYDDIATRSGTTFHTPCGLVSVSTLAGEWAERGRRFGSDARVVDPEWIRDRTGIAVADGRLALYEGPPAGHINPRRLVAAQTLLVARGGGQVIEHAATAVTEVGGGFEVSGQWGAVTADRVLLATGAFGSELLGPKLNVDRRPRTTLMAELGAGRSGVGAEAITSLILEGPADDRLEGIYWVPPVRYPDGVARLKIGGNLWDAPILEPEDLVPWFHGDGSAAEVEALDNSLRALLPDFDVLGTTQAPCVYTGTPTGHPYIGWVDDGLAVAVGGNGSAAKSSDELGRLAATLFDEAGWSDSIPADTFTPQFAGA